MINTKEDDLEFNFEEADAREVTFTGFHFSYKNRPVSFLNENEELIGCNPNSRSFDLLIGNIVYIDDDKYLNTGLLVLSHSDLFGNEFDILYFSLIRSIISKLWLTYQIWTLNRLFKKKEQK